MIQLHHVLQSDRVSAAREKFNFTSAAAAAEAAVFRIMQLFPSTAVSVPLDGRGRCAPRRCPCAIPSTCPRRCAPTAPPASPSPTDTPATAPWEPQGPTARKVGQFNANRHFLPSRTHLTAPLCPLSHQHQRCLLQRQALVLDVLSACEDQTQDRPGAAVPASVT